MSDQMGTWGRGFDWHLTIRNPTFLGVQGELFYILLLWFPFPSFFIIKIFGVALLFAVIAKFAGYDMAQLLRRVRRFYSGRKRPLYSAKSNFLRSRTGV